MTSLAVPAHGAATAAAPAEAAAPAAAPSFRILAAHFGLGILGMVATALLLAARAPWLEGHHFQATTLGLVHLAALGWLTPVALGALLQLAPVLFEARPFPDRLPWVAFVLYVAGAAGLVAHFFALAVGAGFAITGLVVLASLLLYGVHLFATMLRGRVRGLTAAFVGTSFLHFLLAAALGVLLAWNLWKPFLPRDHLVALKGHAHAAVLGFFALLVMGVGDRLLEMFLVSHGASRRPAWIALVATNGAVIALTASFVLGPWPWLTFVGAILAAAGVAAFVVRVVAVHERRVRRRLDRSMRHTVAAFAYLAVAALGGGALALLELPFEVAERLGLAYGFVGIVGFLGTLIVGQLGKILPFLVWLHRYEPLAGLKKIPLAAELLPEARQKWPFRLIHAGLPLLALGLAVASAPLRAGGAALFAAGIVLAARNFVTVLRSHP